MTRAHSEPVALHYSLELEYALNQYFGSKGKWRGLAGGFAQPKMVRSAIRDATRVIRRRLGEIVTADDRLRLITSIRLDAIDRAATKIDRNGKGLLEVNAELLHLVANLLGFDWDKGRPNREVAYFQNAEQQRRDDRQRHRPKSPEVVEALFEQRRDLAVELFAKGLRVSQIGLVLNQPEPVIKDILVRRGVIHRARNVKAT